jgi:uncharacterized protein DUF6644
MTLFEICQAIQDTTIGTAIRESIWTFPAIETVHVLGLAVSVGILVLLDLRLVGAGFRHALPSQIMGELKTWYLTGFVAMFISGILLFWSEAAKCYTSPTFRMKILFLTLAGINAAFFEMKYVPKYSKWESSGPFPAGAKVVGWISIICWLGVIGYGRWTAYGMK